MDILSTFFSALFSSLAQGAPYIIIGYLVAAVIKEFVPVRVMAQQFGNKGVLPLFKAVGLGALLPICSCGVIPLGIGAYKCGTARGTALTFMMSAPTVSPVMILLSLSLLGATFTITFVAVAILGALLIGFLGNQVIGKSSPNAATLEEGEQIPEATRGGPVAKVKGALRWAFWDLGSDVSVDLLIGLSIAAAIIAFLPMQWIATWLGNQNLATLFCVILLGIPVYTCSVPSVPVVQSLLLMGMSPGAGVAYLLAGPATNLGELAAIRGAMGTRTAAIFAGGLFSIAMLGGLVTDHFVFPNHSAQLQQSVVSLTATAGAHAAAVNEGWRYVPTWHYPFIVLLIATLLTGLARRAYEAHQRWFKKPASDSASVTTVSVGELAK